MPAPVLSSFAQRLYDSLAPLGYDDANHAYALANFCKAFGGMFQVVDDYARDQVVGGKVLPGWSQLVDINRAPAAGLGYLGQFVGVPILVGLSDAAQRARIKAVGGQNRGTLASIIAAAQQYLTGAQTVIVRERDPAAAPTDPAYGLTVITYTSQTPDSAKVLAALIAQKPAGIILNYHTNTGADYQSVFLNYATYQDVYTTFLTYQGVVTAQPGT